MYYISQSKTSSLKVKKIGGGIIYRVLNIILLTMKDIKPTWFIEYPIDQEYKQYILLDFLSTVNKDIEDEDIYYPIKRIFSMIKELTSLKVWIENEFQDPPGELPKQISDIITYFNQSDFNQSEIDEILSIIDNSLSILYKYADLGMDLWKNLEGRIRAFNLERFGRKENRECGILIFRNMSSDNVVCYWWQCGKTNKGSDATMLKKIPLRNPHFSLSYEFIAHEAIETIDLKPNVDPEIDIMEIYEDFNEDSVILKIAKELFVREINNEQREKK